jgi:hypothetical protein
MSADDFRINAFVRQVLTRRWVDLNAVRFGATGRIVYFHGRFERFRPENGNNEDAWEESAGARLAENLALLETVEKEIRREPGVVDVVFRFENFRKLKGKWTPAGA